MVRNRINWSVAAVSEAFSGRILRLASSQLKEEIHYHPHLL